jgi:hypothetical protein
MVEKAKKNETSALSENKNPYNICMWKDLSECEGCSIKGELQCHEDKTYSIWFGASWLFSFLPTLLGLIFGFTSKNLNPLLFGIALGGWIIYIVFFFIIWEPQMLCRHCPYYAEGDAKVVHCYANHGFPKTTSFKPAPMSHSEKIQFIIGLILFAGYPIPFLIIGGQYHFLILSIIGITCWVLVLQLKICPDCVNFSCPLNRVPKDIIDSFLKRNPVMKEAWEKSGYKLE